MKWIILAFVISVIIFGIREYKKLNAIEYFSEYKEDDDGVIGRAYYGGI
jgi:hypothetical protein